MGLPAYLVVGVKSRVGVDPSSASADMRSGVVATESDLIQARHVYRDAICNIGEPGIGTVAAALDGELTSIPSQTRDGGGHVLCRGRCDEACRLYRSLLESPVRVLETSVGRGVGIDDMKTWVGCELRALFGVLASVH